MLTLALLGQGALAQSPLTFENNFFVTGDYVVGGWYNKTADTYLSGYATGTITIPDPIQTNPKIVTVPQSGVQFQVPAGADIVAAFLYWGTVEKSSTAFAGQIAYFTPSAAYNANPSQRHQITGSILGANNSAVSWSSGGCTGGSNGTTTMRMYRADVRPYLPVDSNGTLHPNTSYTVEMADSGSTGNTVPIALGATLVIVYRVLSPSIPLNAIVFYDGAYAPSTSAPATTQPIQGFYEPAAASPNAKLTHIVANGQSKKNESVALNSTPLPSLYGTQLPPFPGEYNGSWDNPTWNVSQYNALNLPPSDYSDSTTVTPASSKSGCVNWGAIIFSTRIQDTDGDGLPDYWEQSPTGPNPPPIAVNPGVGTLNPNGYPGYIDVGTGQFVALPGANPNQKDIFVQLDYMCSGNVRMSPDYSSTCDTSSGGTSFLPPADALTMVSNAFSSNGHNINVHFDIRNAIPVQTCSGNTDSSGNTCYYPNQPGIVGWKGGFVFLKNQPLNLNSDGSNWTETQCDQNPTTCVRRFQPGRKDSYHYVMAANALGAPNWSFMGGSLSSVVVDSTGLATFFTSTAPGLSTTNPTGLVPFDTADGSGRVSVSNVISNPNLNGMFFVTGVNNTPGNYSFTVQTTNVPAGTYVISTDPYLSVASGQGGTISGISDIGGEDTLITLGSWGTDGQKTTVQAGTVMHELGHSLALTHGGYYYDSPGSYVPTIEANCKPNFQSVMNYLFQVDLLDDMAGNSVLDFSEQNLLLLDEQTLGGVTDLLATDGSATTYATTKWYTPIQPNGVGSAATHHCDGTPLLPNDPTMYRVEGVTNPISPAWSNNQDINFNDNVDTSLRGYNDWSNVDPRQIGAIGSLSAANELNTTGYGVSGNNTGVSGNNTGVSGNNTGVGGNNTGVSANNTGVSGNNTGVSANNTGVSANNTGVGHGEITREAANSVVRPPKNLTPSPSDTRLAHSVTLNWNPPSFGQIAWYNIYRGEDGATPTLYFPATDGAQGVTGTSYTDSNVAPCHSYAYFVSSVLLDASVASGFRESVGSTSATYVDPCPPANLTSPNTASAQVALNWGPPSGPMAGDVAAYNVYRATGNNITVATAFTLLASNITGTSYTDTGAGAFAFTNNTYYSYVVTALYPDGCTNNQLCRESVDSNTTTTFIHFAVNPKITWPAASAISFGQPLSASTLTPLQCNTTTICATDPNTGAAVSGNFVFANPTFVPPVGSYLASVIFNPTDTYNYNSVTGSVYVAVSKGSTTTTITGITANPNPPILGQTITVNFTVSPTTATGSVKITEDSGATCTGSLTNGAGSCSLTLDVLTASGKSAVGSRALTGTYSGDSNYGQSQSAALAQQVVYKFIGFLSPLSGTGTYSGSSKLGNGLPIKWDLTNYSGTTYITMANLNLDSYGLVDILLEAIYNGPALSNGKCNPPILTPYAGTMPLILFSPSSGTEGNSTFRYDTSTTPGQFIFNWDTGFNLGSGCYTLVLVLDDALPQPPQVTSRPLWSTSVQLK